VINTLAIDDTQLQQLVGSINALADDPLTFKHLIATGLPTCLGVVLGAFISIGTTLFLDWRRNTKAERERLERELVSLNSANTAILFNIELLLHVIMQQIMPHYKASHAADRALSDLSDQSIDKNTFDQLFKSQFQPMIERCPKLYFNGVDLSKDLPFLIENDPNLLKLSGWMMNYISYLKDILFSRNKLIDAFTVTEDTSSGLDIDPIETQATNQAKIANTTVINAYNLLDLLL
jgi:hypothetical protein